MAERKGLAAVIQGTVDPSPMGASVDNVSTILVVDFRGSVQEPSVREQIKRDHKTGVLELHFASGGVSAMRWKEEH